VIERLARPVAMLVAALGVLLLIGAGFTPHVNPDADAYWHAALRLREGQALYGGPRGDETEIYRYAPWFAYAWVPLTYLGQVNAYLVWRLILALASVTAIWPLIRRASPASLTLAVLLGGLLISSLQAANVTPLIVGALVVGVQTRLGPVLLGLAGSLKIFPLLLVAGYLAERRWVAAAVAVGAAALLWLNVLAFDVSRFSQVGGPSFYVGGISLYAISPWLWLAATFGILALLASLVLRGSPWTWLVASAAIPIAVPRVWLADPAYLLVGAAALLASTSVLHPMTNPGPSADWQ
jgi:hypothetical protein